MNRSTSKTTTPIFSYLVALAVIAAVVILLAFAIDKDALWTLIGWFTVLGVIVVSVGFIAVLLIRAASTPIAKIGDVRLAQQKEANRHDEKYLEQGYIRDGAGYKPFKQIAAPQAEKQPAPIDPRHELLVALCMATIRADGYGPTSERLLTADDAQSRGGRFADRNKWDSASKYGQDIGLLYTKVGGKPTDQGLKINGGNPSVAGRTVTDLLEALHSRNVALDAAVIALPGVVR